MSTLPRPRFVLTIVLTALAVAATLGIGVAAAKRAPTPDPRRSALLAATPSQREIEAAGPLRMQGGIQKQFGTESGLLRRWYNRAPGAARSAAAPRATALEFMRDHAAELGLDAARLDRDLTLLSEKASPSGTHLRWNQVVNGVPVRRADLVVKISPLGEVSSVQNNLRPRLSAATRPSFGAAEAIQRGVQAIRPTGKALADYTAELQVVEFSYGARLAYVVDVAVENPMGDWLVYLDAVTGELLGIEDQMLYDDGTGRVFDPDPETKLNDPNLPDNADADSGIPFPGAYDVRALLGITNTAGTFSLSGPFARQVEFESPVTPLTTATHPDSFRFTRTDDRFEDVMDYFHLDQNQRYIQSLGFSNVDNRVQEYDSHGLSGADNSHYVIASRRIAFGDGGVDDGEDADIVIHEYGHSIQHDIVPGWGGGQEGAMGEGFGDYWAGSYSRTLYPAYQPNFVFNWDGHNEFWSGRLLIDTSLHYPENCCGEVHDSGTLWCSGLTDAWNSVGRAVMDRLVLDHHFALGGSATMADAAHQIIQSDIDLYGGAHVGTLVTVFDTWGFVDATAFLPTITHTPLGDTENTTGPYVVTANITSTQPLDVSSLKVFFGTGVFFTDSLPLIPTGNSNEYSAAIPGPLSDVDVRYYLIAKDVNGGTATHPVGAPGSFHQFHVGSDLVPPVITHTAIGNFPEIQWPATVSATVTDNIGVNPDSVRVDWTQNGSPRQTFYLSRVGVTSQWSGPFPSDTTQVAIGDEIAYHITARDVAATPNVAVSPPVGDYAFTIIASRGTVLVLDDDELPKRATVKIVPGEKGGEPTLVEEGVRDIGTVGQSATSIAAALNSLGFTATVETAASSNPATWSSYGLLVSSSGANTSPVANAAYRSAIEAYVAGGGKLLVEGGEVVYDASTSPGYPTFASNVLHSTDWDADNAGALNLLAGQSGHPLAKTPNALPATLPIAYSGIGSEDSYKPTAPAYIVYGVTAQAGNGGILVYDPTPSPQSAQVVVLGFDYKVVSDATTRVKLLENAAEYLLRPEGSPSGTLHGRVVLAGQTDHSGVTVTAQPGGQTGVTNSSGDWQINGVYAFTYDLRATKAGFETGTNLGVVVPEGGSVQSDFVLYPQVSTSSCLSPGTAIPDNNPVGITSDMVVAPTFPVRAVEVSVNIPHTYIGDLIVELRHGVKTVRLHNRTGGTAENLVATYPPTPVDGPGTLSDFVNDPSNGTWTLFVSDNANIDVGNLAQWCLTLTGPADSSAIVAVEPQDQIPDVAWLAPGQPNPLGASGTTIRFALPASVPARLAVYDVTGRLVRTLVDRALPAGPHRVVWDGRDQHGAAVRPGVYLYRLRAGSFAAARRLVVIR